MVQHYFIPISVMYWRVTGIRTIISWNIYSKQKKAEQRAPGWWKWRFVLQKMEITFIVLEIDQCTPRYSKNPFQGHLASPPPQNIEHNVHDHMCLCEITQTEWVSLLLEIIHLFLK